jgi:hypothetical protein
MSLEKTTPTKSKRSIKKKQAETDDNNTVVKQELSTDSQNYKFDEYFDLKHRKNCVISERGAELLATQMIAWCEDEEAFTMNQFYRMKGIQEKTFHRLMAKFPALQDAHDFALAALGDKREIGALKHKYDTGLVGRSMAVYSNAWRWLEEWRGEMRVKANEVESQQKITVVLDAFPSSELVPERKPSE